MSAQMDETVTVAILQGFVHNQGDAWNYTLEAFDHYVTRCRAQPIGARTCAHIRWNAVLRRHRETFPFSRASSSVRIWIQPPV